MQRQQHSIRLEIAFPNSALVRYMGIRAPKMASCIMSWLFSTLLRNILHVVPFKPSPNWRNGQRCVCVDDVVISNDICCLKILFSCFHAICVKWLFLSHNGFMLYSSVRSISLLLSSQAYFEHSFRLCANNRGQRERGREKNLIFIRNSAAY